MTDAHCHVSCGDPAVRELLVGRDFVGIHPWDADGLSPEDLRRKTEDLASRLSSSVPSPASRLPGVGEIGLDRLKEKTISPRMRELFENQLRLALEFDRPVVLHGAKCWGQVVKTIIDLKSQISNFKERVASPYLSSPVPVPCTSCSATRNSQLATRNSQRATFLFHGFSRSDGLIPDIVALGGFISVGPAVLNDHAVNYRELVKKIPLDRLLVETDRTQENAATCPSVAEVLAKLAELRGLGVAELEAVTDANADKFVCRGSGR